MLLAAGIAFFFDAVILLVFGEKQRGVPQDRRTASSTGTSGHHALRPHPRRRASRSSSSPPSSCSCSSPSPAARCARWRRTASRRSSWASTSTATRRSASRSARMLAGLVGGLLVTITGVNFGIGGPISIKAFMMVMIGGAGVVGGAIAGGFILGMLEVGRPHGAARLRRHHLSRDLRRAHDLPRHPPERADGQAVGLSDDAARQARRRRGFPARRLSCSSRWCIAAYRPPGPLLHADLGRAPRRSPAAGVWLTFYIGRINIGQGAYALVGGYVSAILVTTYGVSLLADAARSPASSAPCVSRAHRPADPAPARRLFRHGDAGPDRSRAALRAGAADHQRRQGHHLDPAARADQPLRPDARARLRHPRQRQRSPSTSPSVTMMVLAFAGLWRLVNSRIGQLCRSLQQNEELASSMGVNVAALRAARLRDLVLPRRRRRRDLRRRSRSRSIRRASPSTTRQLHAELLPRRPRLRVRPDARHARALFRLGPPVPDRPLSSS